MKSPLGYHLVLQLVTLAQQHGNGTGPWCTAFVPSPRQATATLSRFQSLHSTSSDRIQETQLPLTEDGLSAQVYYYATPSSSSLNTKPALLFLHGSFHAAWCWKEHYLEYFINLGYPVVASSWRGTGGTPAGDGVKKVPVADHIQDLQDILSALPTILGVDETLLPPPVLLSHSFGGIVVMKYLEQLYDEQEPQPSQDQVDLNDKQAKSPNNNQKLSGLVTMCSVPPSGNGKMTMRFLKRSLVDSYKITVGFAMKKSITNAKLCRDLFFGGHKNSETSGISNADLARYQSYFQRDTVATIDLLDLAKQLPSSSADDQGRASFVDRLPPSLVMGATDDFIVDREGNQETAQYYGLDNVVYADSPHDVMLGRNWKNGAKQIASWLEENGL